MRRELRLTQAEMDAFGAGSGDHSPLHTDAEFGRRTVFGAPIAYGGLETIALLGLLPDVVQERLTRVRSVFAGPLLIGEPAVAQALARPGRPEEWELALSARGRLIARVSASAAQAPGPGTAAERAPAPGGADGEPVLSDEGVPRPGYAAEGPYETGDQLRSLAVALGAGTVPGAILEGIAWASHTVGAAIPGFHGLCAGVTITAAPCPGLATSQWLRVSDYDARSDRVLIEGGLLGPDGVQRAHGRVECFPFAPTPMAPGPPVTATARSPGAGTVAVVGASRGAGAALTLALLEGGYEVHGLYAHSVKAAAELRALAGARADGLHLHQVDAADPVAMARVREHLGRLDGLVLCAAPPPLPLTLTTGTFGVLGAYVQACLALAAAPLSVLGPALRREGGWVIHLSAAGLAPSPEYPQQSAAAAAVEGLLRALAPTLPGAAVLLARPPAMRTDRANTPRARRRALAPERVAAELIALVSQGALEPGITVLTPGREDVPAP